jgi:hypothetical protein
MEIFLFMAPVCAGIGYAIDGVRGMLLGGILGILGLIITAILRAGDKTNE